MAELRSENLKFILKCVKYDRIMATYHFVMLCGDEPVLNDRILPSREGYFCDRPIGGGITQDDCGSYVLKFLRKVLETDEPDYWEPVDSDITITVCPGHRFVNIPVEVYRESHQKELLQEAELRRKRVTSCGKKPDDGFTVVILIDAVNFMHGQTYTGLGISMNLHVRRCELEKFADDLEAESKNAICGCDPNRRG